MWDFKDHRCLQTINIRLPGQVQGKVAEHMLSPMTLHHDHVHITINDYLVVYKMGKPIETNALIPKSHKTQLCCAIYNHVLKQVRHDVLSAFRIHLRGAQHFKILRIESG